MLRWRRHRPSVGRRSGWAASLSFLILGLVLTIASCGEPPPPPVNEPQPDPVAGYFVLEFERVSPPSLSGVPGAPTEDLRVSVFEGPIVAEGIGLEPTGNRGVLSAGGTVYVYAEFELTNDSAEPLAAPVLFGFHREEFRVGTAISQPLRRDGNPAQDAFVRAIRPTHRLQYDSTLAGTPEAFVGRAGAADFVAYRESERPAAADDFVVTVFPYGFAIGGGAAVEPGGSAKVHVGFTFPAAPAGSGAQLRSFVWNAVLMTTDDGARVVQVPEENHARGWQAVLARADAAGTPTVVAIGPGAREVAADWRCPDLIGLANVRIAGTGTSDPAYVGLVPTPGLPEFAGCEGVTP